MIPWQERHVRSLLNQLADEEVTPCKLRQVWNTLKWFSKIFGLLKIDELHRLKSKKSSLEEALTDTVTRPQRKAVVPSKEVIWALEEGAGYDRLGATGPGTQEAWEGADTRCWRLGAALASMTSSMFTPRTLSTPACGAEGLADQDGLSSTNQSQPGPLDCSEVQLHGDPLVVYLGGLGKAVGIRGGIPGHGLLAPDGEQRLCRADPEALK